MEQLVSTRLEQLIASRKPFPLTSLLQFISKCPYNEIYLENLEGLRAIITWFSPIDTDTTIPGTKKLPQILITYEIQQIAHLLNVSQDIIATILWNIHHGNSNDKTRTDIYS